jgi:hypothetical protein
VETIIMKMTIAPRKIKMRFFDIIGGLRLA